MRLPAAVTCMPSRSEPPDGFSAISRVERPKQQLMDHERVSTRTEALVEMSRADVYVDVSRTRTVSRVPSVQLCLILPHAVLYRG